MTSATADMEALRDGAPAPVIRTIGWAILAVMVAFLINNVLIVGYGFGGLSALTGENAAQGYLHLALYIAAIVVAAAFTLMTPQRTLRLDAKQISDFNCYLIRACFFSVFFVGIADAAIALMRVEDFLPLYFDQATVQSFGQARFVGPYVHIPLIILSFVVALFTRTLGFTWLALLIVAAEFMIVISRFVFSYEQALMGDLVRYWYAALFLFASAYTLLDEGHVRVDVLYAGFPRKRRGFVNAIGALVLGITTCWVIIAIGFGGKQSIINSPVMNFEISQTGSVGMFIKYQMAAFLGIFAITMLIQFVSYLFDAVADMRGEPGGREQPETSH